MWFSHDASHSSHLLRTWGYTRWHRSDPSQPGSPSPGNTPARHAASCNTPSDTCRIISHVSVSGRHHLSSFKQKGVLGTLFSSLVEKRVCIIVLLRLSSTSPKPHSAPLKPIEIPSPLVSLFYVKCSRAISKHFKVRVKAVKQDVPPPSSHLQQSGNPFLLSVSHVQSLLVRSHVLQDAPDGEKTNTNELTSDISLSQAGAAVFGTTSREWIID